MAIKVDSAPSSPLLEAAGIIAPVTTIGSGGTAAAPGVADVSTGGGGGGAKSLAIPAPMVTVPVADVPPEAVADGRSPVEFSSLVPEAVGVAPFAGSCRGALERRSAGEGLVAARSR